MPAVDEPRQQPAVRRPPGTPARGPRGERIEPGAIIHAPDPDPLSECRRDGQPLSRRQEMPERSRPRITADPDRHRHERPVSTEGRQRRPVRDDGAQDLVQASSDIIACPSWINTHSANLNPDLGVVPRPAPAKGSSQSRADGAGS